MFSMPPIDDLISVIVPIYNVSNFVKKCIESLINQTYENLEIVLVDDGSTDESGKICENYATRDSRICVYHKENGGLSDARNYGIEHAHGEFYAFVDGDDWIHPQMYEILITFIKKENADIVTCGFERKNMFFDEKYIDITNVCYQVLTREQALSDIEVPLVVAWNKLYKKQIFNECRYPVGRLHEDEFVIHRIFWQCNKIVTIDMPLYFYTERETSIIAKLTEKRINDALDALDDRVYFAFTHQWMDVMTAVIERYCDYTIDRYFDIKKQNYEFAPKVQQMLWRSEQRMLMRFPMVSVHQKYKVFAESPEKYERWLKRMRIRDKYNRHIVSIRRGIGNVGLKETRR